MTILRPSSIRTLDLKEARLTTASQFVPRTAAVFRAGVFALAAGLLLTGAGLSGCTGDTSVASALPALRVLDTAHADELVRAFDAAKDQPRYVVALSPT
jgi:hypothetical protein